MNKSKQKTVFRMFLITISFFIASGSLQAEDRPNIVFILADDMGYGDVGVYNEASQIPTPNLDRLANQGMRFTDAHSPGSYCVPSRYGLMTGRNPIREQMNWRSESIIDESRTTLPGFLSDAGYETGLVGKWHLGFDGPRNFKDTKRLSGGPVDRGFDFYFGIPASLDIPPYFYIKNAYPVAHPTNHIHGRKPTKSYWTDIQGPFWRKGGVAPGFQHRNVLPRLREQAVSYIERKHRENEQTPYFLYLALPAPHTPWVPLKSYTGKSGADAYGDFVVQVDDLVGDVLKAIKRTGDRENTLVVFSSDNGPVWYPKDEKRFNHHSNGQFRGMKGDLLEGGHRMPFIARWPGHVPAGSVSNELISFTDMFATFAAIVDQEPPEGAAVDSVNMLPAFLDQSDEASLRKKLVHDGINADGIRQGPWKLIPAQGRTGFINRPSENEKDQEGPDGQLYNLSRDPEEENNLYQNHPERVEDLRTKLKEFQSSNK